MSSIWQWVGINPSVTGLAGSVGDIVATPTGAYVKFGPGATDWQIFPAAFVSYVTPVVDLLALGLTPFSGPYLAGNTLAVTGGHFLCSEATGAITAAPVVKAGNDGSRVNIFPSQSFPSTAQFALGKNSLNNQTIATKPVVMIDVATPITLEVVTAATTPSSITFKGIFRVFGFLNPTFP